MPIDPRQTEAAEACSSTDTIIPLHALNRRTNNATTGMSTTPSVAYFYAASHWMLVPCDDELPTAQDASE